MLLKGSTTKQESVSSCDSGPVCAACDAVIPDVVIHSADGVTDESRAASTTVSAEVGVRDRDQAATTQNYTALLSSGLGLGLAKTLLACASTILCIYVWKRFETTSGWPWSCSWQLRSTVTFPAKGSDATAPLPVLNSSAVLIGFRSRGALRPLLGVLGLGHGLGLAQQSWLHHCSFITPSFNGSIAFSCMFYY